MARPLKGGGVKAGPTLFCGFPYRIYMIIVTNCSTCKSKRLKYNNNKHMYVKNVLKMFKGYSIIYGIRLK